MVFISRDRVNSVPSQTTGPMLQFQRALLMMIKLTNFVTVSSDVHHKVVYSMGRIVCVWLGLTWHEHIIVIKSCNLCLFLGGKSERTLNSRGKSGGDSTGFLCLLTTAWIH